MRGMWTFRKKQSDQASPLSPRDGWVLTGMNGLSCHMKQPNGPSRPATLWTIKAESGTIQKMLLVQDYADDPGGRTSEQSAAAAMQFVMELIRSGWSPNDYKGEPGELIVPDRIR
jgi:hypothetical protein